MATDDTDLMFEDAMDVAPIDFEAFVNKVNEADRLQDEINGLEATLEERKKTLSTILIDELPPMMLAANINDYTTGSGRKVEKKRIIGGTWPKDADGIKRAIDWLETNDLADLLKAAVTVDFNKEDRAEAQAFFERVRTETNIAKSVGYSEAVHSSTLNAMLRERVNADPPKPVPVDVFNIFDKTVVSLSEPKKSKSKK